MAKVKRKGLGSKVYCDPAGGTTFVLVGMSKQITPPTRALAKIAQEALEDTLATNASGIEEHSQFQFMHLWDPDETSDEVIDGLLDDGDESIAAWKIEYPSGVTDVFEGWVGEIAPETIEVGSMLGRQVTVERTSDITRAAAA